MLPPIYSGTKTVLTVPAAASRLYAYDAVGTVAPVPVLVPVPALAPVLAPELPPDVFDVWVPVWLLPDDVTPVPPLSPPPPHPPSKAMLVIRAGIEIFLVMLIHFLLCAI